MVSGAAQALGGALGEVDGCGTLAPADGLGVPFFSDAFVEDAARPAGPVPGCPEAELGVAVPFRVLRLSVLVPQGEHPFADGRGCVGNLISVPGYHFPSTPSPRSSCGPASFFGWPLRLRVGLTFLRRPIFPARAPDPVLRSSAAVLPVCALDRFGGTGCRFSVFGDKAAVFPRAPDPVFGAGALIFLIWGRSVNFPFWGQGCSFASRAPDPDFWTGASIFRFGAKVAVLPVRAHLSVLVLVGWKSGCRLLFGVAGIGGAGCQMFFPDVPLSCLGCLELGWTPGDENRFRPGAIPGPRSGRCGRHSGVATWRGTERLTDIVCLLRFGVHVHLLPFSALMPVSPADEFVPAGRVVQFRDSLLRSSVVLVRRLALGFGGPAVLQLLVWISIFISGFRTGVGCWRQWPWKSRADSPWTASVPVFASPVAGRSAPPHSGTFHRSEF